MNNYLLTIGIPTYNRSSKLKKTLEKVFSQSSDFNGKVEIIVSDNCSTDETESVVKPYNQYSFFKYNKNITNLGPDGNFLTLYRMATGSFIWLLSDNDNIDLYTVKTILSTLSSNEEVISLLYLNAKLTNSSSNESHNFIEGKGMKIVDKNTFASVVGCNITFLSSLVINKQRFDKIINPEKFENTNFLQSYIAATCASSDSMKVCIIFDPLILVSSNETVSYSMYTVFGKRLKDLIIYMYKELGYNKKIITRSYTSYLIHIVVPGILMAKKRGYKNMLRNPMDFFKATCMYLKSWFLIYPALLIPRCFLILIKRFKPKGNC